MHWILFLLLVPSSFARQSGRTGASTTGCGACHGSSADSDVTASFMSTTETVSAGDTLAITFSVTSTDSSHIAAGLNVSGTGGTFVAGSNTQTASNEITHTAPILMSSGTAAIAFSWVAPAAAGTYTLYGAGNAVNYNGSYSGDGWDLAPDLTITVVCTDGDSDGYTGCDGDCDDADATASPGGVEVCDGVDNDCDESTDEEATDAVTRYYDTDGDGYGLDAESETACDASPGYVDLGGDCDETDAAINPGAAEVCDGGATDEDCDGSYDDDDADVSDQGTWYADGDADGYGLDDATLKACELPAGYAAVGGDCDDESTAFHPGATEDDCSDSSDYNCDGSVAYADADGDGYAACEECNDASGAAYPGATEICDGLDNDCDEDVDTTATDMATWYADKDGDSFGDQDDTTTACDQPEGYVADATDCDDYHADAFPGGTEVWYDQIDQDCDGNDTDQDGDGVHRADDCDDTDPAVTSCDSGDTGPDDSGDTGTDDTAGADDTGAAKVDDGGCGCSSPLAPASALPLGLLALGLVARRRRD